MEYSEKTQLPLLCTRGKEIIEKETGKPVRLRGACVGSWMNIEYYLHGLFGAEHDQRAQAREILGKEKAEYVFHSMMDHFFQEADVAYLRSIGCTVVRITLNYRHFEEDEHPFSYLESGFSRLDQAIGWCEAHGLYVILDLHAAQGCQNASWHSDNSFGEARLWKSPYYQKRFLCLWQELAARYRGKSVIAGYNILNEPQTKGRFTESPLPVEPDWDSINSLYRRAVKAIRSVDPEHIIFLEGDDYSGAFSGLDAPFAENLVYSSHNYSFGAITARYYPGYNSKGEYWDRDALKREFLEKEGTVFCEKYQVPLWIGEFGSRSYTELLDDQISVFEEYGAHWTVWQHKDCGFSSLLRYRPDCAYHKLFGELLTRVGTVYGGIYGREEHPLRKEMREKENAFEEALLDAADRSALGESTGYMLARRIDDSYYANLINALFFQKLSSMSYEEIDRLFSSFAFENCVEHPLTRAVKKYCLSGEL